MSDVFLRFKFRAESAVDEFSRRVKEQWLPEYALDAKRGYGMEGFRANYRVDEFDAEWFMKGLDSELVASDGGGRLRAPRSQATETIFWECGPKDVRPRPINLWREPVITVGALARLHLLHGWPARCLGLQSKDGAFDLVAYADGVGDEVAIAGEVKKSVAEVDDLVRAMLAACCAPSARVADGDRRNLNALRKWEALGRCRAPLFWAVGPAGLERLYAVEYAGGEAVGMSPVSKSSLQYPEPPCPFPAGDAKEC